MLEQWMNLPEVASSKGHEFNHMLMSIHYVMFGMFVVWGFFYFYSLLRFGPKAKDPSARKPFPVKALPYVLVLTVAAIEFFLMFSKDIPFWIDLKKNFPTENVMEVRVVAEQFAWDIHYPGPDGKFGKVDPEMIDLGSNPLGLDANDPDGKDDIVSINQMYLPNNKNVIVHLTSKDVIHSFGLPNHHVKQDAIPGELVKLWFQPTKEGKFDIACSQLCGIGHYRMQGYVNVQSQETFDKWITEQVAAKQSQGSGDGFWN